MSGSSGFFSSTEKRPDVLVGKLQSLVTPSSYQLGLASHALDGCKNKPVFTLALCGLVFLAEWACLSRNKEAYHYLRRPAVCFVLIALIVFLSPESNTGFIYFAF